MFSLISPTSLPLLLERDTQRHGHQHKQRDTERIILHTHFFRKIGKNPCGNCVQIYLHHKVLCYALCHLPQSFTWSCL